MRETSGRFAIHYSVRRLKSCAPKRPFIGIAVMLILVCTAVTGWEARLEDGTRIQVDPRTNRATAITEKGVKVPLWDGVHRLQDGSAIITHSGVVVPNVEIMKEAETLAGRESSPQGAGVSPCVVLERKVCGLHDECEQARACRLGRQLLEFEQDGSPDEVLARNDPSRQKCFDALQDEVLFKPCEKAQLTPSAACQKLLEKTCGAKEQCAENEACGLAHQLVRMEREERLSNLDPDSAVRATRQCQDALLNEELFRPCDQ